MTTLTNRVARAKSPARYDQKVTENNYQALERSLANKHDRRGHLYLEAGKELVLTSDNSAAQYGIGLDSSGHIRVRDMSDGTIGTFSVAWAQVDGAAQEIETLQTQISALSAGADVDLISNPDFESGISGWSNGIGTRGDVTGSAGRLVVTNNHANGNSGGFARAVTPITTEIGTQYTIYAEDLGGTPAISVSNSSDGSSGYASTTGTGNRPLTFTATATTTYIALVVNTATDAADASAEAIYAYVAGSSQSIMSARIFESLEAIATTDSAVATNTSAISANALAIGNNTGDITQNSADIVTEQTARANGDSAAAADRALIRTEFATADTNLQANIDSEASTRSTAIDAEAAARQTLTARVGGTEASLVKNAYFQEEFSGSAIPPEWTDWNAGQGTWITRTFGGGYAYSYFRAGGGLGGIYQDVTVEPNKKYLLIGEIVRASGATLAGAGAVVQWFTSGDVFISQDFITFSSDETTSGIVDASPSGVTRWEKEVTAPATGARGRLYAMTHWDTLGSIAADLGLTWRECNLVPVTRAQAQVEVQGQAIADIEGNLSARFAIAVDGGGNGSFISLEDGTTEASTITLSADEITLDGDVIVTGSITTDRLEANAVTNSGVSQNTASTSLTSGSYVEVIDLDFTSVGIGVEVRASCDVEVAAFTPGAPSTKIDWELRRGTTVLKSGSTNGATETTTPGGLTYNTVRGTVVVDYNDLPSSGTYNYNLRIQVTNGGATPTQSATNRFISAREFKR